MPAQTQTKRIARRQFIIEQGFQNRVIRHFVVAVVASIILSQLITVGFIKLQEIFNPTAQNLIYFSNTLQESLEFSRVLDVLWLPMLISALLGVVLIVIFGILFSHRLAGPLFNLKRMLRRVGEGGLNVSMQIRANDEFHDVEKEFNQMVRNLQQRLLAIKKTAAQMPDPGKKKLMKLLEEMHM